jgi:hypothetical protein
MRWKEAAAMDMDKNPVQEKPMSIITSKLSLSLSLSLSLQWLGKWGSVKSAAATVAGKSWQSKTQSCRLARWQLAQTHQQQQQQQCTRTMQQQCSATVTNLPHPTISFSQARLNRNPLEHHE